MIILFRSTAPADRAAGFGGTAAAAGARSVTFLDASPQRCYALLLYLYENCVQPEIWRDVIEERYPLSRQATPGQGRKDVVPLEG